MKDNRHFDVIIVGGSYAGLSAAMTLGRSLRRVLIIDSGKPCNRQTPHSHNFITQDGQQPAAIAAAAREQVLKYDTVKFMNDLAVEGRQTVGGFEISTAGGEKFTSRKLIFATGIKDLMPDIKGFAESWGISVIHCPYCHGYEVKNEVTGILANGDAAMHYAKLISNLTKDLTIFTNGPSTMTPEQLQHLAKRNIKVIETTITALDQKNGQLKNVQFSDGTKVPLQALYAKAGFVQHSDIPEKMGCKLLDHGLIAVDAMQKTNIPGVYACGDNTALMRSVANAVAAGNFAGAAVNNELCEEDF